MLRPPGRYWLSPRSRCPRRPATTFTPTPGYERSITNMARTTLQSDNVFGDDGGIYQLATMNGSAAAGYTAGLNVTI